MTGRVGGGKKPNHSPDLRVWGERKLGFWFIRGVPLARQILKDPIENNIASVQGKLEEEARRKKY